MAKNVNPHRWRWRDGLPANVEACSLDGCTAGRRTRSDEYAYRVNVADDTEAWVKGKAPRCAGDHTPKPRPPRQRRPVSPFAH